jgi:hypothetical protein
MSNRSEAFWTSYKLVGSIFTASEEHSPAHCLDSEAERLIVFLEEPQ